MNSLIDDFEKLYSEVEDIYDRLSQVQEIIDKKETQYNMHLLELAQIVGIDQIPEYYAEFATNISFWYEDDGTLAFEFIKDEEGKDE